MNGEDTKDKKSYEIAFLAKDEKAAHAVLQLLANAGAQILHEGPLEKIGLAYTIRKETSAYFGYIHTQLLPGEVGAVRAALGAMPDVLRFLIITPPFVKMRTRWELKPSVRAERTAEPVIERKAPPSLPLSNEALEKRIEEILK